MRWFLLALALVVAPLGARAEPTLTEAQAITAARAWVRAAQAGNTATLGKLSAAPLKVRIQMPPDCNLDKTVSKTELARQAACIKKSVGKTKWRDDQWRGVLRDGAWEVEQTLDHDITARSIKLVVSAGRVVSVIAVLSTAIE